MRIKMKYFIIVLIFLFGLSKAFAQELSFNIDSIKIYHLPLSMRTYLSLDSYSVRNFSEKINNKSILQIHTITDSTELKRFSELDLKNASNLTNFKYSLDARIVIDVYMEVGIMLCIEMDEKGYYVLGNETVQRSRNRNLNDWLRKYISDLR